MIWLIGPLAGHEGTSPGKTRTPGVLEKRILLGPVFWEGTILVMEVSGLEGVQKKMAGRLPQWDRLEGKADRLILREVRRGSLKN